MRVKIRKFQFGKTEYVPEYVSDFPISVFKDKLDPILESEIRVKQKEALCQRKEQEAIEAKYHDEYYKLFPDDPFVCYCDDVDNTPSFDPWIMTSLYLWGIENKRHWYEWPDLPPSYEPSEIPNSALKGD